MTSLVRLKRSGKCKNTAGRREAGYGQVGADSGLVLIAEPLVDILVHERCLPDAGENVTSGLQKESGSVPAVAKNDNLGYVSNTQY